MASIKKRGDSYLITISCGYDSQGKKSPETQPITQRFTQPEVTQKPKKLFRKK